MRFGPIAISARGGPQRPPPPWLSEQKKVTLHGPTNICAKKELVRTLPPATVSCLLVAEHNLCPSGKVIIRK